MPTGEVRMRVTLFAVCISVLCGCYANAPLENPHPEPGTKLRVTLTDAGADSLARYLGPGVTNVEGKLIQNSDSAIQLSVSSLSMRNGQEQFWKGEAVTLPRITISTIETHKLSYLRTGLLSAGIIAVALSIKLTGVASGGSNGGGGGGHPQ